MADQEDPNRPSFTSFWKRSKDDFTAKRITFVQSSLNQPSESSSKDGGNDSADNSGKDKAQIRRAQVRKAQIQHRQRKANYVKQLEVDIAGIRDMIATAERDRQTLMSENAAIRTHLENVLTQTVDPASGVHVPPTYFPIDIPDFSYDDLNDLTIDFGIDEVMDSPVFRISGQGSEASEAASTSQANQNIGQDQIPFGNVPPMTDDQTQQAINFILALETICWDHFQPSDFIPTTDTTGVESGHTMMASSLALRTAPGSVFESFNQAKENLKGKEPMPPPFPTEVSWQAFGLTLQSLYGLACSLNPSDEDLTPVQAWFELANHYPMAILLRNDIVNALKREFTGVVKCPHYGAVIERSAFDSVVGRVLGPELMVDPTLQ